MTIQRGPAIVRYPEFQDDLNRALLSETLGEALFDTASRVSRGRRREAWRRLYELEVQTKERLLAFLSQHRLGAASSPLARLRGRMLGLVLGLLPWSMSMALLERGTDPFMEVFERLRRNSSEEWHEFFAYLVAHEQAIAGFARSERTGLTLGSTTPVDTLLVSQQGGAADARGDIPVGRGDPG